MEKLIFLTGTSSMELGLGSGISVKTTSLQLRIK